MVAQHILKRVALAFTAVVVCAMSAISAEAGTPKRAGETKSYPLPPADTIRRADGRSPQGPARIAEKSTSPLNPAPSNSGAGAKPHKTEFAELLRSPTDAGSAKPISVADRTRAVAEAANLAQRAYAVDPGDWITITDNHIAVAGQIRSSTSNGARGLKPVPDEGFVISDADEAWATDAYPAGESCPSCEEGSGAIGGGGVTGILRQWIDDSPLYGNLWHFTQSAQTVWFKSSYLSWDVDGDDLPPLVTTSPGSTSQTDAGVLGMPTTQIQFGGREVNDGPRDGGRIEFGIGLLQGIQFDYYALDEESTTFDAASNGDPFLARPFFNIESGSQDASLLACPSCTAQGFPNINLQGSVSIQATSEAQSAGVSLRRLVWMDTWPPFNSFFRLHFLAGYRFFKLHEGLAITDSTQLDGFPFIPGSRLDREDVFRTVNQFHGGEFGWLAAMHYNRWSLEVLGRLALGNMQQVVDIAGRRDFFNGISTVTSEGGFLTQSSNIGRHVRNEFSVIPEVGAELGFQLTPHTKLTVGYRFIYISQVTRPSDNIDLVLNESTAGGLPSAAETRPVFTGGDSDFWLSGGNVGIEWRW